MFLCYHLYERLEAVLSEWDLSSFSWPRYEAEKTRRQGVQCDVENLRKELDGLTIITTDLEMEIEGLREEHILRRKDHEEVKKVMLSHRSVLLCN